MKNKSFVQTIPTKSSIVKFNDISQDFDEDYLEYGLEAYSCIYRGQYLGCIAFDWKTDFYMFYPQLEVQQRIGEMILYSIANKLYELNKERRLN